MTEQDNPYTAVVSDMYDNATNKEATLRQSMIQGQALNPDEAAKAIPIAEKAQIPTDMAVRNLPELTKSFNTDHLDYQQMLKDYPKLSNFLSNSDNAAVSHDDIPAMKSIADWAKAHNSMTTMQIMEQDPLNPLSHMEALGSGAAKTVGQVFEFAGQGLQNLGTDSDNESTVDKFLMFAPRAAATGEGALLSFAGQSWDTLSSLIDAPQKDFTHNFERFMGMVPVIGAAAAAGPGEWAALGATGARAVGPVMGAMMGGQVYQKAKEMGLDLTSPRVNAAAATAFGLGTFLGPLGGAALKGAIPEAAQVGVGNIVDRVAARLGIMPGSTSEAALTRTMDYAHHIIGSIGTMAGYTLSQNAIYREILGDKKTDLTQGMQDSVSMGGLAGLMSAMFAHGAGLASNYHNAVSLPAVTKESLRQGGELMRESKLFGRSPEKTNEYVNKEMGNNDLYVRPAAFQTFYQRLPPDSRASINDDMQGLLDDLSDSLKTGEDLKINQADYHTYIQPHMPELDGWMRLSPEHWSEGDRQSYEKMMHEITAGISDENPPDGPQGKVHDNLYSQLIQRYGHRTAPTGIPDIADSLGSWLQNSHDTLMAQYGHIPGAADFLHSMIGNMKILREYPELGEHMMKDPTFDTFIDRVRNEQVKAAAPPKMRTVVGKDGLEKKVAVQTRVEKAPTPITDYLASKGGVRRGSDLETALANRGITRQNYRKLFNKLEPPNESQGTFIRGKVEHDQGKYGLRNFDEVNARDLEGSAGHSVRDRENADFVDQEWLLEQVEKEANGEGQVDEAQAHHDAAADDMLNALDHEGISDITRATNEQVKAAMDRYSRRMGEEQSGAFYQGGDQDPRGSVSFGPDNVTTVRLFSRERLDTLLHEFGHIYWKTLSEIAKLPGGESAAADVEAMKDWVVKDPDYLHKYITKYNPYEVAKTEAGYEVRNNQKTVEAFHTEAAAEAKSKALYADLLKKYEDAGGPEWLKTQKYGIAETDMEHHAQTAMEEKLADGFLTYIKTGRSPSVEMTQTFDKFQGWLNRIYGGVKDTLPKINPEVKDVFDRMFATTEQIHAMRNQPEFSPDPALMSVLNKADKERYVRQYDRMIAEAQNKLLREALRQSERAGNKQYKEARAGIRDEMQVKADAEQRYQAADTIIKAGGLDKKAITAEYGKEMLDYLSKHGLLAKKDGLNPFTMATLTGYDNTEAMIKDFMNMPKKKDYVNNLTDQEMISRHGDMLHDGTIEREAVSAYHNGMRETAMAWEMKKMAALAKMPAPSPEAIKARAHSMLGDRVLSTVKPYGFYRAEVRAAHDVGKALAKGDYAAAAVAKAKQLLNHHLYKMAAEAKDSMSHTMDRWSDILRRPDNKLAKGYDIDFIYAARKILGDHDFATGGNFHDLNTWQQRLLEVDPDAAKNIQDILFAAATDDNKPVNKMTWNEFQGLRDNINGLIEQAKGQNTLEIEGNKIEKKEVRATLIDGPLTGKTLADGTPVRAGGLSGMDPVMDFDDLRHQSEGRKDKAKKALLGGAMHFMRMEKWVEAMDGGKFDGPIRQLIYQPVRKALDNYLLHTNENMVKARNILGHVNLLGDTIKAPELKVYDKTGEAINGGKGYTFSNKGELIGAMVHNGNGFDPGSNGYKLVRGNGWHQADWQAFLDRAMRDGTITKDDMDTVQKLWNMMDGMRPDIWRAHKDMYGFYPKEIVSMPFQTPWGEYSGGYWPVKYDPAKDDHLAAAYEKDALTSDSRHAWPTSGKSSTMDRDPSFSRPIQMKLEFLPAHIDWAMRFAHLEPAVREAAKIMFDPEIRKAIDRVNPRVRENVILPWLKRTVRQDMDLSSGGTLREFSGITNFIKDSFYMKTLGLNIRYPLQRVGELGPIAHDTSWGAVMRAFGDLVRDNEGTRSEIGQSPFMHTRAIWFEDNAAKQLRNLMVDRNPYEKIADFSKAHAFYTVRETHRWLDEIQWLAAKYHALEGKAAGVNPDNMQQVMDYADSRVRGSQATFGPGDVSDIEGGSAGLRAVWNIFYSVMNTKLNAFVADARLVTRKDTPMPVRAVGLASVFINRLMIPMFISDSIMRLINSQGPTDQKGHHSVVAWAESAAFDGIKSLASLVPLGSAAADQLLPLFKDIGDKAYNDTLSIAPAAQMIFKDVFESMPKDVYKAIFHNGSKQKAFDSLFTAAGDLLRVPVTPVKRAIDYGAAVHQGKQRPNNGLDLTRGILGGPNIKNK